MTNEDLIRENERMKSALQNIRLYALRAVMGGWRQNVHDMAMLGLGHSKR